MTNDDKKRECETALSYVESGQVFVSLARAIREYVADLEQQTEDLRLWKWIHEDMGCYVQKSASIMGDQWAVLDVDGEVVAAGTTTVDALRAAENKILQSPGHEPI